MADPDLEALRADLAPTGILRAAINLGNPVLAQGTPDDPRGVTVDLARELAAQLGVEVALTCSDAARHSFEAVRGGDADVAFLAVEPARAAEVAFSPPYVLIEGVYAVADGSSITTAADVDRPGVRVGVKQGSAYDLFLTRSLEHAEPIRGADGVTAFLDGGLDVAAGIRQPLTAWVEQHPGHRLLEPRFMEIQQAVALGRDTTDATRAFVADLVEELKASGWVAESLSRSGQSPSLVAPAAHDG